MDKRVLPGGGVLIEAQRGLFRYDPGAGRVVSAGDAVEGRVRVNRDLPGGGVLIGAERGLFHALSKPLRDAEVATIQPARLDRARPAVDRISVTVSFRHPCAPVAAGLGLSMVAEVSGRAAQSVPVRLANGGPASTEIAQLAGEFVFDRPGAWTLALRQGDAAVGKPMTFTVGAATLGERLLAAWQVIAAGFGVLYAAVFGVLLLLTRRSTAAFRILSDAAFTRWVFWPFFFLRHIGWVQRWVLEPWFQEVRRTIRRGIHHLDPPITAADGSTEGASALLPKLRGSPRLWLQGRSGMGKSSVFADWERCYFAAEEGATLAACVRRFGFILIMLPVRHYAALPPPEPNRPESWVIEAVRRRLEMFGLGELDPALVRAMLRAGHIALALDGMNEAERDASLTAFARQFPKVRLLVTSQTRGGDGWQVWQLPQDVTGLRDGLLAMWLGPEQGAALSRRILSEGLADSITSGYDLRLVADLAGKDPEQAVLPADRIGLYRAMLSRATDATGAPLRLDALQGLAWKMVTQRRREISAADATALGEGMVKLLAMEGVRILRQVGPLHEFRHDQMRAFLAASWLVEELPTVKAMQEAIAEAKVFFLLARRDQEEMWRFFAALLARDEDVKTFWHHAGDEPQDRGLLLAALQEEAEKRGLELIRSPRSHAA